MIPEADYIIPVDGEPQKALARGWLWLGVLSLLGSGVFSILLVLARTPAVNEWIPWVDFFHIALVVHVDLSVLVWFAAFSGLMWTLNSTKKQLALGWAGLAAAALGTLMMAVSPFLGAGDPLMSNYVPVLQDQLFYAALLIFAAGMCLVVIRSMIAIAPVGRYMTGVGAQRFGMNTLTVSAVMALVAFVWTLSSGQYDDPDGDAQRVLRDDD